MRICLIGILVGIIGISRVEASSAISSKKEKREKKDTEMDHKSQNTDSEFAAEVAYGMPIKSNYSNYQRYRDLFFASDRSQGFSMASALLVNRQESPTALKVGFYQSHLENRESYTQGSLKLTHDLQMVTVGLRVYETITPLSLRIFGEGNVGISFLNQITMATSAGQVKHGGGRFSTGLNHHYLSVGVCGPMKSRYQGCLASQYSLGVVPFGISVTGGMYF